MWREACRVFGISRTRYYEWKNVADRYGLEALMPEERRAPQMPEATPTHVIEALLTLAVLQPTIGCRQYADRLGDQGFSIAKSTVQKHLVAHGLGKRAQRLAQAAAIAAATTGLVVHRRCAQGRALRVLPGQRRSGRARLPRQLLHRQAQGRGQGVPAQRHRRLHPLRLRRHRARHAQRHHDGPLHPPGRSATIAVTGCGSGPFSATTAPNTWPATFVAALAAKGLRHVRIPARSPNHNAVCERFHGTMLQECWRPAFHRRHFTSIRQLQAEADAWLITYNHRRRNHGDYMRGRTPQEILDNHKRNKAA